MIEDASEQFSTAIPIRAAQPLRAKFVRKIAIEADRNGPDRHGDDGR